MRTPRGVSSQRFIRHLVKHWDYTVVRQKGSHIQLQSQTPLRHTIPVPERDEIGMGLFRSLLSQFSAAKGVSADEILRGL